MAVTSFTPIDIGGGLANGIMAGAGALSQAIEKIGDVYKQHKTLNDMATYMNANYQKAIDSGQKPGVDMLSNDELATFRKMGVGGQAQIMAMKMQEAQYGMAAKAEVGKAQAMAPIETGMHATNVGTDVQAEIAKLQQQLNEYQKRGLTIPGFDINKQPLPQTNGNSTVPQGNFNPGFSPNPGNLQKNGFKVSQNGVWVNTQTGVQYDPHSQQWGHVGM